MKKIHSIILLLAVSLSVTAQSYNGPESVEFDPTGNRYFISNSNNGQILARASDGTLSVFVNNVSPDPYGLEMAWGNLYACCGGKIYGYDMTGTQIFNVNLGATFLNGLAHDNSGNLYATDFSAKKIYRINITNSAFNVFVPSSLLPASPNGIIWDQGQNRLVFVSWTGGAIKAVSLSDSSVTTLATSTLASCDGIAEDGAGNFFISAWGGQKVVKFNNDFSSQTTVMTLLSSPADIFYNIYTDTLAVPNSGNNTVVFQSFAPAGAVTVCNNVPLTLLTDSLEWGASDGMVSGTDSMIHFVIKNTSNFSFAYPQTKFNFIDALPSGTTVDAGSQDFIVFASSWNPGEVRPINCYFHCANPIPANFTVHFVMTVTNLAPSLVDTCSFSDTFAVNLNMQSVSINEINEQDFLIYPNPVENQLTISGSQLSGNTIAICDVLGRIIFSQRINVKSEIINLNSVTPGIYFVTISDEKGKRIFYRKLVKE